MGFLFVRETISGVFLHSRYFGRQLLSHFEDGEDYVGEAEDQAEEDDKEDED